MLSLMVGWIVAGVLIVLSLIHVYWGTGGQAGIAVVVPEVNGRRVFTPLPWATGFVAAALLVAALVVLGRLHVWGNSIPAWLFHWGTWGLAGVFLLRAVGDFRLAGFAKRVHNTPFARWDTLLFSPLCLLLGLALVLVSATYN